MSYVVNKPVKWLDRERTEQLAAELVNDFADGTANELLGEILTEYRDGTRLERGRAVYIKNLLGAMSSMSKELVDDVMSLIATTKPKSRFR